MGPYDVLKALGLAGKPWPVGPVANIGSRYFKLSSGAYLVRKRKLHRDGLSRFDHFGLRRPVPSDPGPHRPPAGPLGGIWQRNCDPGLRGLGHPAGPPYWATYLDRNTRVLIALLIPVTMAIGMPRYRLFDIDVILNRTLFTYLLRRSW